MRLLNHRRIILASLIVTLLVAFTFGLSRRTSSEKSQSQSSAVKSTDEVVQDLENSAEESLRVIEDNDSPLRILTAKVKLIKNADFTKLTGQKTDLSAVASVPETKLINSSGKTITGFVLILRDPSSRTTRGVVNSKVSIVPGGTYTASRESFVRPEWMSGEEKDGKIRARLRQPGVNSEKFWISFAERSNVFVTVARVNFQDGTIWKLTEGGEIR